MQKSVQDLGKLKRELSVEISFDEMRSTYTKVWERLKAVPMKGFRPGHYPTKWLETHFKDQMTNEAINQVIPKYYTQSIKDFNWHVATQPVLKKLDFDRKSALTFELEFEIRPSLDLPDYQKIQLPPAENAEPTEVENERFIMNLRRRCGTQVSRSDDATVQRYDQVCVDYQASQDGVFVQDEEDKDAWISADGEEDTVFGEHLIGMKCGESKTFDHVFSEQAGAPYAGKTFQIKMTVKKIQELIPAELDQSFFSRFGNTTTEADFFVEAKSQLKEIKSRQTQAKLFRSIQDQLDKLYDVFDLPEASIQNFGDHYDQHVAKKVEGISDEEQLQKREEYIARMSQELRMEYILDSIGELESLKPATSDVMNRFFRYAQSAGRSPEELIKDPKGRILYERAQEESIKDTVLNFILTKTQSVSPA